MKLKIFASYEALSALVAQEICALLTKKPQAQLCIAAGHSSLGIFQALLKLYNEKKVDFSRARFVAMDEWLGMNEATPGSCGDFLVQNFLSKVRFESVCLVNGLAEDLDAECRRIHSALYDRGGLDYIVLGMGMNGHLALNEPGTPADSGVHVSALDAVTKAVGTKYFADAPRLEGGLTIGIGDIAQARRAVLCVNGHKKAQVVKGLCDSPVTADFPASFVKSWPHAEIYCDSEAAALLD